MPSKQRNPDGSELKQRQTHVLVTQVLEKLQFSVCPLAEYGSREGLHDLLDGDRGTGELILGGAVKKGGVRQCRNSLPLNFT